MECYGQGQQQGERKGGDGSNVRCLMVGRVVGYDVKGEEKRKLWKVCQGKELGRR